MLNLNALPRPSGKRIALHVTPAAERALRGGHPWVFDQAIRSQSHAGQSGDLAVIFDARQRFLAIGLYDPRSPIRVRVLQHHTPAAIDRVWFTERLRAAANIREQLLATGTDGYRLVHGENDGLPGLVVDRYAGTLVIKFYTAAWLPHLADILAGLTDVQPAERVVLRYSRNMDALMAPYGLSDGQVLSGAALSGPVMFQEHGLRFAADVAHGHKTGFFFDQRENRAFVRALSAGRTPSFGPAAFGPAAFGPAAFGPAGEAGLSSDPKVPGEAASGDPKGLPVSSTAVPAPGGHGPAGRRMLDLFAYSGGFSVYAAAGGAASVTSVDISAPALEAAAANLALNRDDATGGHMKHKLVVADAFEYLERLHGSGRSASGQPFDMLIIDPPSFAKSSAEIERALAAYRRLARLATGLLAPDGVLVMASCSSRVTADAFFDAVTQAAQQAGHPLTEIRRTGHALDHPITFPEGEYLKCLFASVAR